MNCLPSCICSGPGNWAHPRPAFPHDPRLCFDVSYEPIATGKLIVVPSMVTDSVTALDSDTGEECWTFFADGPVRFAPLAWEGKVYFVSDDGCLYCLSADEGRLLWKFCALPADRRPYKLLGNERLISRWPARGGPVLVDGIVYFAAGLWPNEGVFVSAVDASTGRLVWTNADAGFVPEGLLDHGTRRDGGLSPQGYLAVLGAKLIVPSGRALPALFDRKSGRMEPYTTGWGGRVGLAKGSWYACGIGDYLFQSGDLYELARHPEASAATGAADLPVTLDEFARQMNTSVSAAREWIKHFGLDAGEQAGEPFVRVRTGRPGYLSLLVDLFTARDPAAGRAPGLGKSSAFAGRPCQRQGIGNISRTGLEPRRSVLLALRASTRRAVTGWRATCAEVAGLHANRCLRPRHARSRGLPRIKVAGVIRIAWFNGPWPALIRHGACRRN